MQKYLRDTLIWYRKIKGGFNLNNVVVLNTKYTFFYNVRAHILSVGLNDILIMYGFIVTSEP